MILFPHHFMPNHIVRRLVRNTALEENLTQSLLGLKVRESTKLKDGGRGSDDGSGVTHLNTHAEVRVVPNNANIIAVCFFKGLCQPFIILSEAIEEYLERIRATCGEQLEELGGTELFRFLVRNTFVRVCAWVVQRPITNALLSRRAAKFCCQTRLPR